MTPDTEPDNNRGPDCGSSFISSTVITPEYLARKVLHWAPFLSRAFDEYMLPRAQSLPRCTLALTTRQLPRAQSLLRGLVRNVCRGCRVTDPLHPVVPPISRRAQSLPRGAFSH